MPAKKSKKAKKVKEKKEKDPSMLRKYPCVFSFNERELKAFEFYCKRFRVKNKSKFIRETLVNAIMQRMADESTLFALQAVESQPISQPNLLSAQN